MIEIHEAAEIMPLDEKTIPALAADIKANGLIDAIETLDGKVIDGRRRLKACELAGVAPRLKTVTTSNPVSYVVSKHTRRSLTSSQWAMVGARATALTEKLAAEAKERQREAVARGNNSRHAPVPEPVPELAAGDTRDVIGKLVGVSGRTISYAMKVIADAVPEVVKAVDDGRMAVKTAALLATESPEAQIAEVNRPARNRGYVSVSKAREQEPDASPAEPTTAQPGADLAPRKLLGVGIIKANEAINCLMEIPRTDALRMQGLKAVEEWIRRNKKV